VISEEERFKLAVEEARLAKNEWEALDHSECDFTEDGAIHICTHPFPANNIPSRKMESRVSQQLIQRLEKLKRGKIK